MFSTSFSRPRALLSIYAAPSLKNTDIPPSSAGFDSSDVELLQRFHLRFSLSPAEAKYKAVPKCAVSLNFCLPAGSYSFTVKFAHNLP